jgi:hypothetical protein
MIISLLQTHLHLLLLVSRLSGGPFKRLWQQLFLLIELIGRAAVDEDVDLSLLLVQLELGEQQRGVVFLALLRIGEIAFEGLLAPGRKSGVTDGRKGRGGTEG